MSILVRVVFWGLIGFVPHEEGQKGLTALFVDPTQIKPAEGFCAIPKHVPVVYLLDGQCEPDKGQCVQVPFGRELEVATHLGEKTPKLRWLIEDEDLEIFGQERKVEFRHRGRRKFGGRLRDVPERFRQTGDYSWVTSMGALTGGHGQVREDCLRGEKTCPLNARFTIRGGRASACHLFHEPEEAPKDETRKVVVFDFSENRNGRSISVGHQAVADAVQVEFEVEGDHVDLQSWGLASIDGQQQPRASVRLKPAAQSRTVTLLVVNSPVNPKVTGEATAHGASHGPACTPRPHSDALFALLARQPEFPTERLRSTKVRKVNPGTCEAEIADLARARVDFGGIAFEAPHATTSCDGASYP
jgi:hypothetical protein